MLQNLMVAKCSCAKRPSWRCSKMKHDMSSRDPEGFSPQKYRNVASGQKTERLGDRQSQKAGLAWWFVRFLRFKYGQHSPSPNQDRLCMIILTMVGRLQVSWSKFDANHWAYFGMVWNTAALGFVCLLEWLVATLSLSFSFIFNICRVVIRSSTI